MSPVDVAPDFTLGDLRRIIGELDETTLETLSNLVQCPLRPFMDEAAIGRGRAPSGPRVHYVRVARVCEYVTPTESTREDDEPWVSSLRLEVDGVGETWPEVRPGGVAHEAGRDVSRCNRYALDMTPLDQLSDLPIRIDRIMTIRPGPGDDETDQPSLEVTAPDVTLLQMIHALFWEVSFYGTPAERDAETTELRRRIDDFDAGRTSGIPLEDLDRDH